MDVTPARLSARAKLKRPDRLHPVVAIGGVGGSGTRVGAALLQMLGYYIGGDLNAALDNLWFTLLFKRRDALRLSEAEFGDLLSVFWERMSGGLPLSEAQRSQVFGLAEHARPPLSTAWLIERATSFIADAGGRPKDQPWGWKEPNTHLMIDRILRHRIDIKYIHFVRHPLDMAISLNQSQLRNWGAIVLERDIELTPRFSLSYWCAAHRRMMALTAQWPERIMLADFDMILESPNGYCDAIETFLDSPVTSAIRSAFGDSVNPARPVRGRFKIEALDDFDPADIDYIRTLGYRM